MLNDSAISFDTAQVLTPNIQQERKQVGKERGLDLGVAQVMNVLPQISRFRSLTGLKPHKPTQVVVVSLKSLLRDLVGRTHFSVSPPKLVQTVPLFGCHSHFNIPQGGEQFNFP